VILIDNTVLSNYALIDRLQLLQLFCGGQGMTTDAVLAEFHAGTARRLFKGRDITWIRRTGIRGESERLLFEHFQKRLGAGEASCLAVAIHRKHGILTDDMDARKVARRAGIQVSGSVGVLVTMVKQRVIDLQEGNKTLQELISAGYFSPVEELDGLL
jgi:predicted nucleic acid-binding protein